VEGKGKGGRPVRFGDKRNHPENMNFKKRGKDKTGRLSEIKGPEFFFPNVPRPHQLEKAKKRKSRGEEVGTCA